MQKYYFIFYVILAYVYLVIASLKAPNAEFDFRHKRIESIKVQKNKCILLQRIDYVFKLKVLVAINF